MATVKEQFEQVHEALGEVRGDTSELGMRVGSLELVVTRVDRNVLALVESVKGERGLLARVAVVENIEKDCGGPKAIARHALHITGLWAAITALASAAGLVLAWAVKDLLPHLPILQELAEQLRRLNGGPQ